MSTHHLAIPAEQSTIRLRSSISKGLLLSILTFVCCLLFLGPTKLLANDVGGSITIHKQTDTGAGPAFDFTGTGGLGAFSLAHGGSQTFPGLVPGDYTVAELVPAGWKLDILSCSWSGSATVTFVGSPDSWEGVNIGLETGADVSCTFYNKDITGSITIEKSTDTGAGPAFDFTGTGGLGGFSLSHGGSQAFPGLVPGDYTVAELVPAGWEASVMWCVLVGAGSLDVEFDMPAASMTIDLQPGQDITCGFVNEDITGSITIEKSTDTGAGPAFDFTGTGGLGDFSLSHGDESTFPDLAPGDYSVNELLPPGWGLSAISCSLNSGAGSLDVESNRDESDKLIGVAIHLGSDQDVTCTFHNDATVEISVQKTANPTTVEEPGDDVEFTVMVTNEGEENVTIDALSDSDFDLATHCPDAVATELAPGEAYSCTFTEFVGGNSGDTHSNEASATASSGEGAEVTEVSTGTVTISNASPSIEVSKVPDQPYLEAPGGEVVFAVDISNQSVSTDPVVIREITDDPYGDLLGPGNTAIVSTTCSIVEVLPGDTYSCEFTVDVAGDAPEAFTDTVSVEAEDDEGTPATASATATVNVLPPSAVTDSSLCQFDRDGGIEGQQFRLLFTPDLKETPAFKLPASNPGQFFYNVFYLGEGTPDLEITVPYPFVTQGSMPVHFYTELALIEVDGITCFVPDPASEIFSSDQEIVLRDYGDGGEGSSTTIELGSVPESGFVHVAIHLDYGLKGTNGYSKDGSENATDVETGEVLISNLGDYSFGVAGSLNDGQDIQNVNVFKRISGIAGLVTSEATEPVVGARVQVHGPTGDLLGMVLTDEDGWYLLTHKHTGRPANYTVTLPDHCGLSDSVKLKGNGYGEVNFVVPAACP